MQSTPSQLDGQGEASARSHALTIDGESDDLRASSAGRQTSGEQKMTKEKKQHSPWLGLATLMLPVLLISVDNTVLNLALPEISVFFAAQGMELLWVMNAYSLVLAGLLVTMGSLGDRFGRRKMLLIGAIGFGVVSTMAAFSPSIEVLIAARAVMAIFGAMIAPATLSLIRNMFSDKIQRRLALAIWMAGFSVGGALGPTIGGVLLQQFFWGSIFLIAIPLLVLLLILAPIFVPESRDPHPGPIRPLDMVLSMLTLGPAVFAIKTFAHDGFNQNMLIAVVIAVVAGMWFGHRQLNADIPLLDLRLFTQPAFTGSVLANLAAVFSFNGFLFFISQHLQLVMGYSPLQAGLLLLPGAIIMIVSGLVVVPISRHRPVNRIISICLLFEAIAFAGVAIGGITLSLGVLILVYVLLSVGIGGAETLSNDAIMAAVPKEKAGAASAISETAYEVGTVLGIAILGSIVTSMYRRNIVVPASLSLADHTTASETLGGAVSVAERIDPAVAEQLMTSAKAAFDSGVNLTTTIGAIVMAVVGVLAWVTLRNNNDTPAVAE